MQSVQLLMHSKQSKQTAGSVLIKSNTPTAMTRDNERERRGKENETNQSAGHIMCVCV